MLPPSIRKPAAADEAQLDVADREWSAHYALSRSTSIATALPPPRHSAATPIRRRAAQARAASVTSTRAPLAPIGWPSAIAPPCNIHAVGRDLELPNAREHLHGKRFVDFEQVDVIKREARFGNDAADRFDGRREQILRLAARGGRGDDSRERLAAQCARLPIRTPTTTAAAPSLIMDELPAVIVVSGPNAGFKRASCARSVSARGPSSREIESSDARRLATGTISAANSSSIGGRDRPAMTFQCEPILFVARDAGLRSERVGDFAHRLLAECAGEPIVHHRIDQRHGRQSAAHRAAAPTQPGSYSPSRRPRRARHPRSESLGPRATRPSAPSRKLCSQSAPPLAAEVPPAAPPAAPAPVRRRPKARCQK